MLSPNSSAERLSPKNTAKPFALKVLAFTSFLSFSVIFLSFSCYNIEKDVTIVAFMNVDITAEEKDDVLEEIREISGIESYEYQSKTDIANDMMESSEDLKNILSQYTEETSPLQPTYLVKVKDNIYKKIIMPTYSGSHEISIKFN